MVAEFGLVWVGGGDYGAAGGRAGLLAAVVYGGSVFVGSVVCGFGDGALSGAAADKGGGAAAVLIGVWGVVGRVVFGDSVVWRVGEQ